MQDARFIENLTIKTGNASNTIDLTTQGMFGDLLINSGSSADLINLVAGDGLGSLTLNAGLGHDNVTMTSSGAIGSVTFNLNDSPVWVDVTLEGAADSFTLNANAGVTDLNITIDATVVSDDNTQAAVDLNLGEAAVDAKITLGGTIHGFALDSSGNFDDKIGLIIAAGALISSPNDDKAVVFNLAEGSVNANIDLGGQVNGFVVNASGDFGDIIDLTTQDTANLTSVNNTDKAVVFNLANGSLDAGINLNGQIEGLGLITTGSQDDKVNLIVQDAAQITSPTIDQFSIDFALGKGSLVADLHLSGQVQGLSLQTSGDYSDDFDFVADLTASITSSDNLSRAINVDLGHGAVDADLTVTKDVVIEGLKLVTGTGVDDIKMSLLGTIEKPSSASDSALELRTDGGQDSITVQQAGFVNGMLLKGGDNADDYRLTVAETATGNIKIDDTTATDADSVGNTLVVDTQENGDISDQFLFRDGLLYRYGINQNQRIDYSGFTALSLFTYGGDDNFIFDESTNGIYFHPLSAQPKTSCWRRVSLT